MAFGTEALKFAKEYRAPLPVVDAIKAAVDAGGTTNLSGVAPYRQLSDAFVLSLRQFSCFDRMLPFFRAVPVHQQIAVISGGATAATVVEAAPVPIATLQFTLGQVQEQKTICIAGITAEIMREASSDELMKELVRATVAEVDRAFVAKITTGLSVTASNGGTSIGILQDLAAALTGLTLGATSKVFLIVSSDIAKHWSFQTTSTGALLFPQQMTPTGGVVQGCEVTVSEGITGQIVAVDATQILGSAGAVELDSSREASLQMAAPADSPPTASTPYVSAWQMNYQLLKAVRVWGAAPVRSGAVSLVGSVSYSGNSPGLTMSVNMDDKIFLANAWEVYPGASAY